MTIERLLEAGRALHAGELDRAEQIYRQVAEGDPRSSIAVVGLARVALERGAAAEAFRLAESALAIDPSNAAARRLVEASSRDGAEPAAGGPPPNGGVPPPGSSVPERDGAADAEWPWPDLEEQLVRYREREPGFLARLWRRGRH